MKIKVLFRLFSKIFLGQEKAVTTPMEFLNLFFKYKNLSFTHCVEASDIELEKIKILGCNYKSLCEHQIEF